MNKILKLALILFLISAIVAGVLGVVNNITAPRIEALNDAKTAEAYAAVLQASGYTDVYDQLDVDAYPTIDDIAESKDDNGWVVTTTFSGAQGMITMIVGVDPDYKCTGISITEHSETSGLGANAASTGEVGVNFRAQFLGVGDDVALAKKGGTIDALAGATITSNAVTSAVANSIKAVESLAG